MHFVKCRSQENNYDNVKSMSDGKEQAGKIRMMTDYSVQHSHHDYVPDPYYGGASGFELVLDLLEDACEGLLQAIKSQ